ncbi:MAG: hypothetical protein Q9227_003628 [Pyrenula ochraceoflavens]
MTIVGGSDGHVGVGGWILGGGHSPLSSRYGMGADQILSMEVVTADGEIRIVNETQNADLFWALRGGGGSTFGIMIAVTVKVYPPLSLTGYLFAYNTTSNSKTFWSMTSIFHSYLPTLSDQGVMGYYYVEPKAVTEPITWPGNYGTLYGFWLVPERNVSQTREIIEPLEAAINSSKLPDRISISYKLTEYYDFWDYERNSPYAQVGISGRLGSRLLDRAALTGDAKSRAFRLQQTTQASESLIGHLVAGPGPQNAVIPGGSNAVLPAWRNAYVHIVLPRFWGGYGTSFNATHKAEMADRLRNVDTEALHQLAPSTGAYMSEADPTEPDWQHTFWGEHYPSHALEVSFGVSPEGTGSARMVVGFARRANVRNSTNVQLAKGERAAEQLPKDAIPGDDAFTAVHDLDFWDSMILNVRNDNAGSSKKAQVKVTGMPGKHVPPGGVLEAANDLMKAVSELLDIPRLYSHATGNPIDLMLIHLGGTTIPSPSLPLLMVTMDAKQGIEMVKLIQPDLTLPIHFDDYDVFLSPLEDFKKEMELAGLKDKVVYLERGDGFGFTVK